MIKQSQNQNKTLYLVGGGPGDPELLTLKAINVLAKADVVLYDALINTQILQYCKQGAIQTNVGKRHGGRGFSQEEIFDVIENSFEEWDTVVRLKGGDPFIFGRGFEELLYARTLGVCVEYIPGISSAYAVPGLCSIPLTSRNTSDSFMVLAGTSSSGYAAEHLKNLPEIFSTIVVLMGFEQLAFIVEQYQKVGKVDVPIAVIQDGSLPTMKCVRSTMSGILEGVTKHKVSPPAIIVIGDVVGLVSDTH